MTAAKATRSRRAAVALVRAYQTFLSPLLPRACRYWPTCSAYAVEAIERYGAGRGGWMALKRLLRCHPRHPGGFDPVPECEAPAAPPSRR